MKPLALTLCLIATPALADPSITLTPPADLAWDTTDLGVAFAPLMGDRQNEAYIAMVRLPAGTASPAHVKSAAMHGVMLEGQMTHALPGQTNSAIIGPGGYYHVPADLAHVSTCVSDTPCVTMLYQDGAFDFVPVAQ